jgi:hydroxypyruvate reductase
VPRLDSKLRRDAVAIFKAGLDAADAGKAIHAHFSLTERELKAGKVRLPLKAFDRIFLLAVGKAAPQMCREVERILGKRLLSGGLGLTKHGHAKAGPRLIEITEAGHPIPDEAGAKASEAARELLRGLNARDLLIVALSGGASALLSAPAEPVTLAAKQKTTDLLLRAGADIFELNAVRKHLSFLKGGQLAALAHPATIVSLLLSDVIGDPIDVIGSGPTAPDLSTFADAVAVLNKFGLLERVPASVRDMLQRGVNGELPETPKPGDPLFQNVHNIVVGSNSLALAATARKAKLLGYKPLVLSSTIEGETREVARVHASILREVVTSGQPARPPLCILSGGETTVTVRGKGKGGRNQEFALATAAAIAGLPNVAALSVGTDGTDGPTDAAGAIATGETVARANALGLNPSDHLLRKDAYPFFDALGDLLKTGPTGTNVMDINILLAG